MFGRAVHIGTGAILERILLIALFMSVVSCGSPKDAVMSDSPGQPATAAVEAEAPAPPEAPVPPSAPVSSESPAPSKAAETQKLLTSNTSLAFSEAGDLEEIVGFLASDELKGRDTGSEGLDQAAAFLASRLEAYGISPYFGSYRDTLVNTKEVAYNIVGVVPGSDPELSGEIILIGAHYDHIGIVPLKNGDGIANGANDNASGTATVLELARYFAASGAPKRSLVFAFFSAEERGLLGSKHLAEKLQQSGAELYGMLNFEMTGVPMKAKDYLVYLTGYHKSNLAEVSNNYGGDDLVGYLPQAADYNLFQRSDNYSFFQIYKVPAHTFSTFDFTNYAYYHQPGDESNEMDFTHMAELVNRMIPVVSGIANASEAELKLR